MNTYGRYQNAYRQAAVGTMDQNKLIVMLYDGAIRQTKLAIQSMQDGNIEKVHNSLVKSKNIISELMASLDMDQGGDIAKNLQSLYVFMFGQLIEANMTKQTQPAETVLRLLLQLREAWAAIGKKQPAVSQPSSPGMADPAKRISLKG
ncbi:MAG: flagellar export chaperone FliS [SAR324 cluster bacterium]|nr:flagellar export chaperone FliS [SAR324 cluster bacterium]